LKQIAASRGICFGAAASLWTLSNNLYYRNLVISQCVLLVCENEMKFTYVSPTPGAMQHDDADWIASIARSAGFPIRGHTLVYELPLCAMTMDSE